jgi:2-polyprenyl-3-methyl-5-hydroxy-6-metoxy-1,4-benzoquinol methylase
MAEDAGTGSRGRVGSERESDIVALQETLYQSRNSTRRWLHQSRRDWIHSAIRKHAGNRPGEALEVGPGSGVHLPVLCEEFNHVVATDIHPEHLDYVRRLPNPRENLELVIDDISKSELPSDQFDLILCSEVIEHIPDPRGALEHMHRLLKPGGALVLSTPQPYSPLELLGRIAFLPGIIALVRFIYREPIMPTGHISLLSRTRLLSMLRSAGFMPIEEHASGVYLPGIAEFGGERALRFERRLESSWQRGKLRPLLWTQFHVATA